MKTFRVTIKENADGDNRYVIQRKTWFGWMDYCKASHRGTILSVAMELRDNPGVVVIYEL